MTIICTIVSYEKHYFVWVLEIFIEQSKFSINGNANYLIFALVNSNHFFHFFLPRYREVFIIVWSTFEFFS